MRCPRCHRIAFQEVEKCPNCGFVLSTEPALPVDPEFDVTKGTGLLGPLGDFSLERPGAVDEPPQGRRRGRRGARPPLMPPPAGQSTPARPAAGRPLSVRRKTPQVPKFRTPPPEPSAPPATLAFEPEVPEPVVVPDDTGPAVWDEVQDLGRRLVAGMLDATLLLGVDIAVVYLTLRLAGVPVTQVAALPMVPLGVFFLLLNGGYLVVLTALGGQTVGKMALGLRVVARDGSPVSLRRALGRTIAYGVSVLPAGLGFVAVFLSPGRALHDMLAGTRVVSAA